MRLNNYQGIRKYVMFSLRSSYHFVIHHPFLLLMLCLLIFLRTSFPFLFSLFLHISPVLACTAVLLATLLSYGQPYIPEFDHVHQNSPPHLDQFGPLRVSTDSIIVQRDENMDYSNDCNTSVVNKYDDSLDDDHLPLIAGTGTSSGVIQCEKNLDEDGVSDSEFEHDELRNDTQFVDDQLVTGNQYALLPKKEYENFQSMLDPTGDQSDHPHDDDNEESSISGASASESSTSASESDIAEGSSPDASMANIMPMLDELHPLLDLEAPQPAHIESHHDSDDAASELSRKSDDKSDEEEAHYDDKESGHNKSAITWTEDDQKNLIDLGTSELERNLRLENLIARRRARKSLRLIAEKNLIDLESADPPFNMPPISTTRFNPFDSTYDSYDNMHIPGSAPSIMFQRKNPFDIPYEPTEEKPNLTGDSFQQEFKISHPKDTFFRRHQSFSLGPSVIGSSRHDNKWRPYFVPERLASDEFNYPLFHRQSSGISDSKESSNHETESIYSAADEEEKALIEHDIQQETEQPSTLDQTSDHESGSDSSEEVDCVNIEQVDRQDVEQDELDIKMDDLEGHREAEINLETSRERSYDVEFVQSEFHANVETDEDNTKSSVSSSSVEDEINADLKDNPSYVTWEGKTSIEESNSNDVNAMVDGHQIKDPVYDSSPSAAEKLISFSFKSTNDQGEDPKTCLPPISSVSSDVTFVDKKYDDVQHESSEHVTSIDEDSQASTLIENAKDEKELRLSNSTVTSEFDVSNASIVPEYLVEQVITNSSSSSSNAGSADGDDEILQHEKDNPDSTKFDTEVPVDVRQISNDQHIPSEQQPPLIAEDVSAVCLELSSLANEDQVPSSSCDAKFDDVLDLGMDKKLVSEDPCYQCEPSEVLEVENDQVQASSRDAKFDVVLDEDTRKKLISEDPSNQCESSEVVEVEHDQVQLSSYDAKHDVVLDKDINKKLVSEDHINQCEPSEVLSLPVEDKKLISEDPRNQFESSEVVEVEHDQVQLSCYDAKHDVVLDNDINKKLVSEDRINQCEPSEVLSLPVEDKEPAFSEKAVTRLSFNEHKETQGTEAESVQRESIVEDVHIPEVEDKSLVDFSNDSTFVPSDVSKGVPSLTAENEYQSHGHTQTAIESHDAGGNMSGTDDMEEIDEGFLSELDAVGDFIVIKDFKSESNEFDKYDVAVEEELVTRDHEAEIDGQIVAESVGVEYTPSNIENKNGESGADVACVVNTKSIEDIEAALKQMHEGLDVADDKARVVETDLQLEVPHEDTARVVETDSQMEVPHEDTHKQAVTMESTSDIIGAEIDKIKLEERGATSDDKASGDSKSSKKGKSSKKTKSSSSSSSSSNSSSSSSDSD